MHPIRRLIPILFILCPAAVLADAWVNTDLHYRLALPVDWKQIPDEVLVKTFAEVAAQAGIEAPKYEAGFQAEADNFFTYPYLLIQHHPVDTATIMQISSALDSVEHAPELEQLENSGLVGNITMGKPVVDEKNKMVVLTMESEVANVGPVKALNVAVPGRDGMVTLHLYSRAAEFDRDLPVFQQILDGFAYDEGHAYNWSSVMAKKSAGPLGRILRTALIGAVVGGIAGLLMAVLKKKKA